MDAALSRLRALSADELREEIIKANLNWGPITATTRAIFERKLARVLLETTAVAQTDGDLASVAQSDGVTMEMDGAQSMAASEEGDVGYDLGLNPPEEEPLSKKITPFSTQPDTHTPPKTPQISPTLFFGVCPLWEDTLARNERAHVYTDKKEALQAVKLMKGARFKAFSIREDAEKFAKGLCDYYPSPSKSVPCVSPVKTGLGFSKEGSMEADSINREKANSFKSPRTQDLTAKLRRAVEKGDETAFSELVWSNPRYLIGSGDNPTVVQEGCRYNVMHVAAKENQAGIAQLLLDILENPEFMRLMYPDDQDSMLHKRIQYITDLYLNTPDKASFETPLHFACKFGCAMVVNVLCSHPDIDKNSKNKYDQRPADVICERMKDKSKIQEVKQKISEYLEDRFYVPLLRACDNSSQPVIAAPWSPELMENRSPQLPRSPRDPVMTVRAFAGPLSPSKADEFRRVWKTPPRERAGHFHHILKSDPDRGAERVGRDLARELGHPWAEYWDFLDSFVDLASAEGLGRLEEFLSKKNTDRAHDEAGENETSNKFRTPSPGKPKKFSNSVSVGAFLDEGGDISLEEIKNRQNAALTSCSMDVQRGAAVGPEFHILPVSHGATLIEHELLMSDRTLNGQMGGAQTCDGCEESKRSSASSLPSPISNLMEEFERMSLRDEDENRGTRERRRSGGRRSRDVSDIVPILRLSPGPRDEGGVFIEGERGVAERVGRTELSSESSEEYFLAEESLEGGRTCSRSRSWDQCSSVSSASYKSLEHSNELILTTPPRAKRFLFIDGDSPTKLDKEVLSAVEGVEIDPVKYPSIHKWKNTILSYSCAVRQSWPTPAGLKSHRMKNVTPGSPVSSLVSPAGRYSPARHTHSPDYCSSGRYSPAHASYSPAHTSYSPASYIQRIRLKHFGDSPI
ncbi:ankyrin repeat and LEM domain-containing protein 2-like isoform X2 [Hoplias malabaricus]|uniref:ankyrin repeat and LEM domain-containing protein 2-like isoform X2 n=1 Tax=Hoplias malabaricus TaxID=27720 RepID=UPI0034621360